MRFTKQVLYSLVFLFIFSCTKKTTQNKNKNITKKEAISLRNSLTFFTSFDNGTKAVFGKGDTNLYTVTNRKQRDFAKVGLYKQGVTIAKGKGLYGDALSYTEDSKGYLYYNAKGNMNYTKEAWEGAISFWLSLNPDEDLEPGYCDPIQITDSGYNDAGFWVDFTKENPRDFRLGVIGDRDSWNPNPKGPDNENPIFINQLVTVDEPGFSNKSWTHIVINFKNLNRNGEAAIYVNGVFKGVRNEIKDPFTWDIHNAKIYLGLGYIGLMDEISIYNKYLFPEEIKHLYTLKNGVQDLLEK
ncbi:hypothetical protein DUT90_10000 [Polaribacter sp. WD7]|uniref:LamG-like jellyroll fold domain-containing protein n=1 Tax=Polaribacter sp. WD7 TaxID=2269061 RepID=UPI000DF268D2|nr:LamG-like jellyroll fold domain-containing protein [Polaribacter sp. WD7]RCS26100.1 hypothetical protein DUT90_10000 [Polaribacter sp. WD7]